MKRTVTPPLDLLVKLGSIAVHAEELISAKGHPADKAALTSLLHDPQVKVWIEDMTKLAFLPVKR